MLKPGRIPAFRRDDVPYERHVSFGRRHLKATATRHRCEARKSKHHPPLDAPGSRRPLRSAGMAKREKRLTEGQAGAPRHFSGFPTICSLGNSAVQTDRLDLALNEMGRCGQLAVAVRAPRLSKVFCGCLECFAQKGGNRFSDKKHDKPERLQQRPAFKHSGMIA